MTRPADTLFSMNRLRRFNRTVWMVLFGTLLVRTSYFMSWPFLIILLNTTLDVSPFWVATMLGVSAATAALTGWYIGYLSDKWGKKPIMMLGCLLAVACYGGLVAAFAFWHYFVIMALLGLVRAMVEVVARAILCDALDDAKDRELALNLRYFIINIGGAIGPLFGLWIGLALADLLFMMTAAAYLMYCIW
ncbi:MAG: MFS transporter, partial [Moraxella sp.]|nr:MFS transporter [Moraxella sp.]